MIELPTYVTKLPILNKEIEIQPLTVKQEKNIGAAKQTGGNLSAFTTFIKILDTLINVDVKKLSEPDLIHCILEMRKFSIGEKFKTSFVCPHTKQKVSHEVDCESIQISGEKRESVINDMGYVISLRIPKKQKELWSAIQYVETAKEKIDFSELTNAKKENIFDALPVKVKNKMEKELNSLLHYEYKLNYVTDKNHTIVVRSAEDFFILLFVM
jgi:hypothetical protein